ncbi:MAG: BCCT family transporter, partial [Spongiibacteraceae bacterium]|nr:BCCT family transporter [Spongiibacteraceae bacterium]
ADLTAGTGIAEIVADDVALALFAAYDHLPLSELLSGLSILLIFTFLVTSADSATYILASMTTRGSLAPPLAAKLVWGVLMSSIAAVLLASGGLSSLQTASLVSALPFTVILVLLTVATARLLRAEPLPIRSADLRLFRRMNQTLQHMEKAKTEKPDHSRH